MTRPIRFLLAIGGTVCVGLGILGAVLPLLPTTPFLLLAAVLYSRSSDRSYQWLLSNRWFGATIRRYREGRGMRLRHKVISLVLLWGTTAYSIALVLPSWWSRALLGAVALGVTVHLLHLKTH